MALYPSAAFHFVVSRAPLLGRPRATGSLTYCNITCCCLSQDCWSFRPVGNTGRCCRVRYRLREIEPTIKRLLNDHSESTIAPCTCIGSPVKSIYVFHTGVELCRAVTYHDMLAIIMNQAILSVTPGSASRAQLEEEIETFSTRIWMMHKYGRHLRPMGFYFYMTALNVTYESAKEQSPKDWIVALLNVVQGGVRESGNNYWTEELARTRGLAASGRSSMPPH